MEIKIHYIPKSEEESVILNLHDNNDALIHSVKSAILPKYLTAKSEDKTYRIAVEDIYYIESVDRKQFVYTERAFYQSEKKLYELEALLADTNLIRVSKSTIVNLNWIQWFEPKFSGNFEALLNNNERVQISRRYVSTLRKKLDMTTKEIN